MTTRRQEPPTTPIRSRPGGRSARVRGDILRATLAILDERGYDATELPEVARRAGVHPTTVYRRWPTKARLVGEAILEGAAPLIATPDTGSLRTDLETLVQAASMLFETAPVRALIATLVAEAADPSQEVSQARARFWTARLDQARQIVDRAVARAELPADADPGALIELVMGPVFLRAVMRGRPMDPPEIQAAVGRAMAGLSMAPGRAGPDRARAQSRRGAGSRVRRSPGSEA